MNNNHLDQLTKLLKRARPRLASTHELEFKNVFGAVGGYMNGNIFISCGTFGVALRLPPEPLERVFKEKGVSHLQYFSKGVISKRSMPCFQRGYWKTRNNLGPCWISVLATHMANSEPTTWDIRVAERVGFEPTRACTLRAFQTRLFGHSSTSPQSIRNGSKPNAPARLSRCAPSRFQP